MNQELNINSLKEGVQYLCEKDPHLRKIVKKRQGQINLFKRYEVKVDFLQSNLKW